MRTTTVRHSARTTLSITGDQTRIDFGAGWVYLDFVNEPAWHCKCPSRTITHAPNGMENQFRQGTTQWTSKIIADYFSRVHAKQLALNTWDWELGIGSLGCEERIVWHRRLPQKLKELSHERLTMAFRVSCNDLNIKRLCTTFQNNVQFVFPRYDFFKCSRSDRTARFKA